MREFPGQASGLQYLAGPTPTRLVAVAALPQSTAALQLLWLLTRQSWPGEAQTLVLDGQASEKADGLSHWLDKPAARLAALVSPDGLTPVISARLGLLTLCECARTEGAARARERLMAALPAGAMVLLSAPPEMLAMLLMDSDVHPLVALDGGPRAVVSAYNALKVLLHAGGLHPVLVPMHVPARHAELQRAEQAVLRCCREHLGEPVQSWPVAYHDDHVAGTVSVPESWWLRVLDSALAPETGQAAGAVAWQPRQSAQEMAFRSR